ncbi:MAG: GxxExxY protein [Planctomycetales bacterium]|nr:GxxExxY protein [Planctomycetales bacterium]
MTQHLPIPEEVERVASAVIDAAFRVHRALGPGLLESVYEACLCYELSKMGIPFKRQLNLPVVYEEVRLDTGLRFDILADEKVVVELKAVDEVTPVFKAQTLTYLRLTGKRLGLLINFNTVLLKDGIFRIVL